MDGSILTPAALAVTVALIAGLCLTPLARTAAVRAGVLDRPDGRRKLHARPVPLWGGVAVYLAICCGLAAAKFAFHWEEASNGSSFTLITLLFSAFLLCGLGCLDDSVDLGPRRKLLLQATALVPVLIGGSSVGNVSLLGWTVDLSFLGPVVLLAWLLACVNAINLIDGMDGLAASFGIVAALAAAVIAALGHHDETVLTALALAGALAGFLAFNLPPASIYLGDSGSMVIGLFLGAVAWDSSRTDAHTLRILLPFAVMTVPLLDSVFAVVRRRLSGRRFDAADRGHIHHRLMARGLGPWQVLLRIMLLAVATGSAAGVAANSSNDRIAALAIGLTVVLLVATRTFGHQEWLLARLALNHAVARVYQRIAPARSDSMPGRPRFVKEFLSGRQTVHRIERENEWCDSNWHELIRTVRALCVRRLEVDITTEDGERVGNRAWEESGESAASGVRWNLEMTYTRPGRMTCVIRVQGSDAGFAQQWAVARLIAAVRPYGEAWSATKVYVPRQDIPGERQAA
jgi:UDP-GlcNAc:undecaprenyl-phosphate GlcNAc-1-phosphate transferase